MCEIYGRPAEIWAYDSTLGARKLRTFHEGGGNRHITPMRVSYYVGGHYDSLHSCTGDTQRSFLRSEMCEIYGRPAEIYWSAFKYPDKSEYVGESLDGMKHGQGTLRFEDGSEYK